jgi:hypothetical protein
MREDELCSKCKNKRCCDVRIADQKQKMIMFAKKKIAYYIEEMQDSIYTQQDRFQFYARINTLKEFLKEFEELK